MAPLTISIVSHGHDPWLAPLLAQLAETGGGLLAQVIVTHNLPPACALCAAGLPYQLTQLHNAEPLGFGPNHNRAFRQAATPLFCVLNPDIALPDSQVWDRLVSAAQAPRVGCAYPRLLNPDGTAQDNARAVPTPWALFRRRVLRRADLRVDWASAAFWVVPSPVFQALGGFDERYFMYCEDVDFCLRLQSSGWRLASVPQALAIHDAQRRSLRGGRHLQWHLRSLWRLWTGAVLLRYLRLPRQRGR